MPTEVAASAKPSGSPGQISGQGVNPNSGDPSKATNATKIINAPFQIVTHHERQRWLKILFYGKHGAGKTELACSAVDVPEMRDVIVVNAESGDSVTDDSPRINNPELLYPIKVTRFDQVGRVLEFCTAYCKARDAGDIDKMRKLFCSVTGKQPSEVPDDEVPRFKTVILDSLTEIEVYAMYSIMNVNSEQIPNDADIEVAGWPEFRKNNEMVKLIVRMFRDLPMHVIFVCSEGYSQDEMKKYHYAPQLTGKLASQVQGFVDIVGRIVVGQSTNEQPEAPRRVYVQPISGGPIFDAKNRRPQFKGAYFENPSMSSIMRDIGMLK